jgi:alkylation response protein AidB-like acyl-CoA dehydrogenase
MDFTLTEEQKMVKTNSRDFFDKEILPEVDAIEKRGYSLSHDEMAKYFKKLGTMGFSFTDIGAMKDMMVDPVSMGFIMEDMGRVWPSLGAAIGMSLGIALVPFSPPKMKERLLPRLQAGDLIGFLGITEPEAGCDERAIATKMVSDGDYYVVSGQKTWISNAPIADMGILVAVDETGTQQMLLVDKEESPWESSELHKIGWRADPTGQLFFDNCRVPKENSLSGLIMSMMSGGGLEGMGNLTEMIPSGLPEIAMRIGPVQLLLSVARAGMAVMAAGIDQAALEASIDYAKERKQFGKPIGKFQLIQDMIVEMLTITETSRLLGFSAIDAFASADPLMRGKASLAKAYACNACSRATWLGIQVLGGNGLSEDYPVERYFRDARMMNIPDGTAEMNTLIAGRDYLGLSAYV